MWENTKLVSHLQEQDNQFAFIKHPIAEILKQSDAQFYVKSSISLLFKQGTLTDEHNFWLPTNIFLLSIISNMFDIGQLVTSKINQAQHKQFIVSNSTPISGCF